MPGRQLERGAIAVARRLRGLRVERGARAHEITAHHLRRDQPRAVAGPLERRHRRQRHRLAGRPAAHDRQRPVLIERRRRQPRLDGAGRPQRHHRRVGRPDRAGPRRRVQHHRRRQRRDARADHPHPSTAADRCRHLDQRSRLLCRRAAAAERDLDADQIGQLALARRTGREMIERRGLVAAGLAVEVARGHLARIVGGAAHDCSLRWASRIVFSCRRARSTRVPTVAIGTPSASAICL